jgi:Flp pilus assembly protein TadG
MGEWTMSSRISLRIFRCLRDLQRDRRGNVTVMMGFLLPPLIGTFGLGFEVANWYLTTRSMQNAADSAAVAIATTAGTNYLTEARALAAQYGFVNGVNNVTVAASNTAACPGGGTTCYSVTITQTLPLFLSQIIGYAGNAILNQTNAQQQTTSVPAQQLTSTAVASQSSIQVPLCLLALGTSGAQDIVTNGNPHANMSGCSVMANTSARCNGGNLGAPYGLAHVTDSGCGVIQVSGVPTVADQYAALASNIPSPNCPGGYPQADQHGDVGVSNQVSGSQTWSGNVQFCGDVKLTGDVTVNAPTGAVLVIQNGQLDTAGFTLRTASGSGLTIVFSGSNGSYTHAPTSSVNNRGTIDIAAPTTGPWSGIAMYQDPNVTTGVNMSAAGNAPTWDISGLIYMPHSTVTLSGAVNKSSNGQACFVMVMDSITINGTGDVLSNNTPANCSAAGVNLPYATVPGRGQLVS